MDSAEHRPALVLRGGRVVVSPEDTPQALDIAIAPDGRIQQIAPAIEPERGTAVAELKGRLIVSGLVDVHQHLDKTRTRDAIQNPKGTLDAAVQAFKAYARNATMEEIAARAEATIELCIARGTTAIRTHVNVGFEEGLSGLRAMAAVRDRTANRIRLQLVALLPPDADSVPKWSTEASSIGVDALGSAPARATDADACLRAVFDAAERHHLAVDLHLDEHLDAARHLFREVAEVTIAKGMQDYVVAGHCSALGALPLGQAQPIIEALAKARVGVVALPAANLYLLGRDSESLVPRGITRVDALCRAGVNVACASDNIQDAFVPSGTGDLIETARWTMLASHLGANDFGSAFAMITEAPAGMMHLDGYGIQVGGRADLLIATARDVADLIASGPIERTVLFSGNVVAGRLPFSNRERQPEGYH